MYELFLKITNELFLKIINNANYSWLMEHYFTKENKNNRVYDLDELNSFDFCSEIRPLSLRFLMKAVTEDRRKTTEEIAKEFIQFQWEEFNKDLREYNLGRRSTIIL